MRRGTARLIAALAGVFALLGILAALVATGVIWPGRIFAAGYAVRGVDISSYQGEVDWDVLSAQDIDFAYIKATEGSSSVDSQFVSNWEGAVQTDLLVGAYHFVSFDSSGETQAAHVIETVPDGATLPIALDFEYYGDYFQHPPAREKVDAILVPLLEMLEEHYGAPPVIYATPEAYDRYLSGRYAGYPIWIRSIVLPAQLEDGRDWTLWQYSNRDRLEGYDGVEHYIDMNVFNGTREELAALAG
ncbi:lysozyme [Microbacterium sp. NEAU-LLC]|uniref:Lysozyme n=1 Tax=Microbacterium helvum TaxID=2773713 RepID=A0ABR8NVU5_9MICO|nr:GH25 family lysozyme [Microbacterium helvum]MBD3943852.1 lysozyme [Microbacterium helvum]